MEVASVDDEEIDAHVPSRLLHAAAKGYKVAPIRAIVLLLQVTLEPAMSVGLQTRLAASKEDDRQLQITAATMTYRMKKVDLTPFQGAFGSVRGTGRTRLHALDLADMLDFVRRAIARVFAATNNTGRGEGDKPCCDDTERPKHDADPAVRCCSVLGLWDTFRRHGFEEGQPGGRG